MKKIIVICSLILSVALIFTAFTSCKGNNTDDTSASTTDNKSVQTDNGVFSAVVGESSVVIMCGDEVYQTMKYPMNSGYAVDLAYAQEHYEFIDMNFDGQPDFYIAVSSNGNGVNYFCWLYNATSKQFDYSVSLSGLTNISVDSDNHRIISTVITSDETKWVTYKWVDGVLTFDSQYSSKDESVPEDITEIAKENVIGSDVTKAPVAASSTTAKGSTVKETDKPKGDTTKTSASSSTATSTTKQDKPLNTTTTAPATNQSVELNTSPGGIDEGWF